MAEQLKTDAGCEVEQVNGDRGEFSIWVEGKLVIKKGFLFLPSVAKAVAAVRQATQG